MIENKFPNKTYLMIISILLLLIVFGSVIIPGVEIPIKINSVHSFNNNWSLYTSNKYIGDISLPVDMDLLYKKEGYKIIRILDLNFNSEQTILIRGSLASVEAYLNDEMIYKKNLKSNEKINIPMASMWHFVNIPEKSEGKELKIIFKTPYESMSGLFNSIKYGDKGDLIFYLFNTYGSSFLIGIFVMFLGIVMILSSVMFSKKGYQSLISIGLFAVLLSFWLLTESKILQVVTGSQLIIGSLAYISLSIVPIPLVWYIKTSIINKGSKLLDNIIRIFLLNLFAIIFLQFTGEKDFFESVIMTLALIFITIIIIVIKLYSEIKNSNNKAAQYFSKALSIFLFFIMIQITRFFIVGPYEVTSFINIGLLLFVIMLIVGIVYELVKMVQKSYKAEFFEKLAFRDQLTNGYNRMAFEKDLEKIFSEKRNLRNLRLVILDINNLKVINDNFGHVKGDKIIKEAFECIKNFFGKIGRCYRIGGDEFACIIIEEKKDEYQRISKEFKQNIFNNRNNKEHILGIAFDI